MRTSSGTFRRRAGLAGLSALILIGCASDSAPPTPSAGPYTGLPVGLEQVNGKHVVVFTAPHPGWEAKLDWCAEAYRRRQAFLTVRRPNPLVEYAQVIVTQRVDTTAEVSLPLDVYVRDVAYDDKDPQAEYRLAVSTDASNLAPGTK